MPVCYGVIGDNAKYLDYRAYLYGYNYQRQVPFPVNAVVPNNEPYTYRVPEADSPEFVDLVGAGYTAMKLFLNGKLIPIEDTTLVSNHPDEPGLVNFNSILGEYYFHSADAGKQITGYYSYISS